MDQDPNAHVVDVLRSFDTCMLVSVTADGVLHGRPMAVVEVGDDGHLTFLTGSDTPKSAEIEGDERVVVTFQGKLKFATLRGRATLQRDVKRIEALWKPAFQAWFPNGPADPTAVLVEVSPDAIEVWDHGGAKGLKAMFERAKAIVTHTEAEIPAETHEVVGR